MGPQSRLAHLRVTPLALRGEVLGLVLWGDGYRVEVAEVRFALVPSGLLRGKLAFRFLHLRQPVVVLTGSSSVASSISTSAWRLPATIEDLRVVDGRLELAYPALQGELVVPSIGMQGAVGKGSLVVTAPAATWHREKPVVLGPLSARLAVREPLVVRLEALEASASASRVRVSGEIGSLAAPDLDLLVQADLDARDAALFGLEDARGELKVTGTIVGKLASLRADLQAASEGLAVAGTLVERLEARVTHEGPSSTRVLARGSFKGGSLRAEVRLAGGEVWARADATDLPLSRLPGTSGVVEAGTLSGVLEAHGPLAGVVPVTARFVAQGIEDALGGAGRLEASASGWLRPADSTGEGQWRMALDRAAPRTLERAGMGAARLRASGTLKAGGTLRVEGRIEGEGEFQSPGGPNHRFLIQGTLALAEGDLNVDVRALEGESLNITLRTRQGEDSRLQARATAVDLQPFLGSGGGTLTSRRTCKGSSRGCRGPRRFFCTSCG